MTVLNAVAAAGPSCVAAGVVFARGGVPPETATRALCSLLGLMGVVFAVSLVVGVVLSVAVVGWAVHAVRS